MCVPCVCRTWPPGWFCSTCGMICLVLFSYPFCLSFMHSRFDHSPVWGQRWLNFRWVIWRFQHNNILYPEPNWPVFLIWKNDFQRGQGLEDTHRFQGFPILRDSYRFSWGGPWFGAGCHVAKYLGIIEEWWFIYLPSLKRIARTWNMMLGRWSFPVGKVTFQRGIMLVSGSVAECSLLAQEDLASVEPVDWCKYLRTKVFLYILQG